MKFFNIKDLQVTFRDFNQPPGACTVGVSCDNEGEIVLTLYPTIKGVPISNTPFQTNCKQLLNILNSWSITDRITFLSALKIPDESCCDCLRDFKNKYHGAITTTDLGLLNL